MEHDAAAQNPQERRNAERIRCRTRAKILFNGASFPAHIVDLSLTGAQIAILEPHTLQAEDEVVLVVDMKTGDMEKGDMDKDIHIELNGCIAHKKDHILGMTCKAENEEDREQIIRFIEKSRAFFGITSEIN